MERRRVSVFIVFAAVIGVIGWIFVDGFEDTMVYYITVPELQAKGVEAEGQGFRVSGTVVLNSVVRSEDGLTAEFKIKELGKEINVVYRGIVPDTFKEDIQVLLEGNYHDGKFEAVQIFTKCASKYNAETGEYSPSETSSYPPKTTSEKSY